MHKIEAIVWQSVVRSFVFAVSSESVSALEHVLLHGQSTAVNHMQDVCRILAIEILDTNDPRKFRRVIIEDISEGDQQQIDACEAAFGAAATSTKDADVFDRELGDLLDDILSHDVANESEIRDLRNSYRKSTIGRLFSLRSELKIKTKLMKKKRKGKGGGNGEAGRCRCYASADSRPSS